MGLENCITSQILPIFRPAGAYAEYKKSLRIDFEGLFIYKLRIRNSSSPSGAKYW